MKDLKKQIAEDICTVNCWKTPKDLKSRLGRDLTEDECRLVFEVLSTYVSKSAWLKVWCEKETA